MPARLLPGWTSCNHCYVPDTACPIASLVSYHIREKGGPVGERFRCNLVRISTPCLALTGISTATLRHGYV